MALENANDLIQKEMATQQDQLKLITESIHEDNQTKNACKSNLFKAEKECKLMERELEAIKGQSELMFRDRDNLEKVYKKVADVKNEVQY